VRILTVVGARPQFVKAAILSAELAKRSNCQETIVHTGQHYDFNMSQVFFDELQLPSPDYMLEVGSGSQAEQTGEIMRRLEPVVEREQPDWLLIYGDTNTTLAAALVGAKSHVPVAHVEAGLRSFNRSMPEEINRVVADHVSSLHLAPTQRAAAQLADEGIRDTVRVVGDLMVDLAVQTARRLPRPSPVLAKFGVAPGAYAVATIHRASNTDDAAAFERLVAGLRAVGMPVVFPIHPRSAGLAAACGVGKTGDTIVAAQPLPYLDMIALMRDARVILTDSGGMQKEALALRVPCVTLREETEWVETLDDGWNVLAGTDTAEIGRMARRPKPTRTPQDYYGTGNASARHADALQLRERETKKALQLT
jgi:UDP-GlcNAc3NAcA epimerase